MKFLILYLLFFLFLIGCNDGNKLAFDSISYTEKDCPDCPEVSVEIPKTLKRTRLSMTIDAALEEELISLLIINDEIESSSITEAIQSFKNGYQELKKLYPDETAGWEAKIKGTITFENKNILTIELRSYLFTGGAHGYSTTRFLNFDKKKGVELENWELFKNTQDFEHFAEKKFRIQENIPQAKSINHTGFMFKKNSFSLPENIGFTQKGILLLYNQYEVASYADGSIKLTLPYSEVIKYLSEKTKF